MELTHCPFGWVIQIDTKTGGPFLARPWNE
jgi:hypothetical protein